MSDDKCDCEHNKAFIEVVTKYIDSGDVIIKVDSAQGKMLKSEPKQPWWKSTLTKILIWIVR